MKKLVVFLLLTICIFSAFSSNSKYSHYNSPQSRWCSYVTYLKDDFGNNKMAYIYYLRENYIQFYFDNNGIYPGKIYLNSSIISKDFKPDSWSFHFEDIYGNSYDFDNSKGTFEVKDERLWIYFDDDFFYQIISMFRKHTKLKLTVFVNEDKNNLLFVYFGEIDCSNFTTIPSEIKKQMK